MGLDMYLERHTYVQNWDHHPPEARWQITATRGGKEVELHNVTNITEGVAYWRKANAIHAWFVDVMAKGVDECQPIEVREEDLRMLVVLCRRVLDSIEMRDQLVERGQVMSQGHVGWKPILEPGQAIVDPEEAEQLLPSRSGFFFGNTDYDDGYVADLRDTIEQVEAALRVDRGEQVWSHYIYRASW